MTIEKGVNDTDSPADETVDESLSDEGDSLSPSKPTDRPELNVLKEENRKLSKAFEKQQSQLAGLLEEKETRLEKLQEKSKLSGAEEREMATLEDQINSITSDPKSKPWLKLNEKISKKATKAELDVYDHETAMDKAEEYAEAEGMEFEKFEKKIVKFVRLTNPALRESKRMAEAYKLYKKDKALTEREDKLVEKEKNFVDGGGKVQVKKTLSKKEAFERIKSGDDATTTEIIKSIAKRQQRDREASQG